jgi:hypothetical protein
VLFKLLAAAAGGLSLLATALTWLRTGLGIVSLVAGLAMVLATVSLVISASTARHLTRLNEPAVPPAQDG